MTYGETTQVKTDLGITGSTYDARLSDWNDKASSEWDDMLYLTASKRRRITQLPKLPLATAEVTETDKDGTNYLIKAKYYENLKRFETAKNFRELAMGVAVKRIERLRVDTVVYGRVIR